MATRPRPIIIGPPARSSRRLDTSTVNLSGILDALLAVDARSRGVQQERFQQRDVEQQQLQEARDRIESNQQLEGQGDIVQNIISQLGQTQAPGGGTARLGVPALARAATPTIDQQRGLQRPSGARAKETTAEEVFTTPRDQAIPTDDPNEFQVRRGVVPSLARAGQPAPADIVPIDQSRAGLLRNLSGAEQLLGQTPREVGRLFSDPNAGPLRRFLGVEGINQGTIAQIEARRTDAKALRQFNAQQKQLDRENRSTIASLDRKARGDIASAKNQKDAKTKVVTQEGNLRKEFTKLSGVFIDQRDSFTRIQQSAENPSGAGDLSLIFNFMKMLDPRSTVREGEFATAQQTGSIPQRITGLYNKVITGERLTVAQREDFINRAGGLFEAAQVNQDSLVEQFTDITERNGLNIDNVILEFTPPERANGKTVDTTETIASEEAEIKELENRIKARQGK